MKSNKKSWEIPRLITNKVLPTYTKNEIRERIMAGEYLIVIDGYVLKINALLKSHPGGELALYHAVGKDASDEMHAMHPDWVFEDRAAKYIVAEYCKEDDCVSFVEDLDLPFSKPTPVDKYMYGDLKFDYPAIRADYYSLFEKLRKDGFFQCNYFNYAIEVSRWLLFAAGMFGFILIGEPSTLKCIASALCTAALWHQAVFTAHDLGHSAVTANRKLDTFIGILLGDFIGGLSVGWWKKNHNVHHIVTNQPENDPDIQHLPFFAISPLFYQGNLFSTYYNRPLAFDRFCKAIVVLQDKLYYIIMLFGRFNLYVLSWQHVLLDSDSMHPKIESSCMLLFWFQIEHHLFPRLPRHNLRLVRPLVIQFCKKHNLPYTEDYFLGANIFTMQKMHQTAQIIKAMVLAESKVE
ncbi:Delta(8)-fatty-acid desaturase [Smittium mucronatum]|uniref:Delta(8)-fatty-acid desaturase n=1 Tax=Smittium mucronatum TaxID=133383 RepID=A0A1R0H7Q9_9FUNG|nr:Delta(8)-fatty-acid desaturase [Smittium mucronatum]